MSDERDQLSPVTDTWGQFPQNRRSTVANRFPGRGTGRVRPTRKIVGSVLLKVAQDIRHTRETLERWPDGDWADDNRQRFDFFRQLMESLGTPRIPAYASILPGLRNPPQTEKDRIKTRQRDTHIQAHMAGLEPTEAQLGLLRKLGWAGQPSVDNRRSLFPHRSLSRSSRTPRMKHLDTDAIPAELKDRPQWVVWRLQTRDGKPTKVPFSPTTGRPPPPPTRRRGPPSSRRQEAAAARVCWHRLCVYRL